MSRLGRGPTFAAGSVLAWVLIVASPAPAHASHYRLVHGFSLVTEPERAALKGADVQTTVALLDATAKRTPRRALSKTTGISFARLTELATQCDLLRVKGLGPSAVRLLQAARVRHTGSLRHAAAANLHARFEAIKSTLGLPQIVPDQGEIQGWIGQAKKLRSVLEGVR
jgi:hypothetical protein